MHWFKIHHGFTTSKKFAMVAHELQIPKGNVLAIVLEMLECASKNSPRGSLEGLDAEEIAFNLGYDVVTVRNALLVLCRRYFCNSNAVLNWQEYQNKSDRTNSQRQARHREKKKQQLAERSDDVTASNALRNTDKIRKVSIEVKDTGVSFPSAANDKNRSLQKKQNAKSKEKKIEFDFEAGAFLNVGGKIEIWREAYPAVDITQQLNEMAVWLKENPANRKKNYGRFITNWLSRKQDRAPRLAARSGNGAHPPAASMSQDERQAIIDKRRREVYGDSEQSSAVKPEAPAAAASSTFDIGEPF